MALAVVVGVVIGDVRFHVPLLQLQPLLYEPCLEGGEVLFEFRLVRVAPPAVLVALNSHTLDQLHFFRHDFSKAAI
ncbi:hypothetical protein D3C78_1584160 [compost metagenome]